MIFHQAKGVLSRRVLCCLLAAFLLFLAAFLALFTQKSPPVSSQAESAFLSSPLTKAFVQAETLAREGRGEEALLGLEDFYKTSSEPTPLNSSIVKFRVMQAANSLLRKDPLEELSSEKTKNIEMLWEKALHHSMLNSQRPHSEAVIANASRTVLLPQALPNPIDSASHLGTRVSKTGTSRVSPR